MTTPGVDRVSAADRPPADVPEFDHARAEAAVRELLIAIGEDPDREGLHDTPARVARAYAELTAGLRMAPEDVLSTTFDIGHDEMVLVRDIASAICVVSRSWTCGRLAYTSTRRAIFDSPVMRPSAPGM